MKGNHLVRVLLDIVMLVAMLALMNLDYLDVGMHERVGLTVGLLILGHLLVNSKQVEQLIKKIARRELPYAIRLNYVVDVLLLVGMILMMVTGVGISQTIFREIHFAQQGFWMDAHDYIANITLLLLVAHLWLHRGWIRGTIRIVGRVLQTGRGKLGVVTAVMVLMVLFAGVSYADTHVNFSGGRGEGAVVSQPSSGVTQYTLADLAQYDGQNGRAAYVAVDGTVYDVGQYFVNGVHHDGVHAGTDLTGQVTRRQCARALDNCPVVGQLAGGVVVRPQDAAGGGTAPIIHDDEGDGHDDDDHDDHGGRHLRQREHLGGYHG